MIDLSIYEGHTPGPWSAGIGETANIRDADSKIIAQMQWLSKYGRRTETEVLANMNLFLDAPAILAYARELQARNAELVEALNKIAVGDGIYGAQAWEYKGIARDALSIPKGYEK